MSRSAVPQRIRIPNQKALNRDTTGYTVAIDAATTISFLFLPVLQWGTKIPEHDDDIACGSCHNPDFYVGHPTRETMASNPVLFWGDQVELSS